MQTKTNLEDIEESFVKFLNRGEPSYERVILKDAYERVKAILQGRLVPPYELEIQLSSICNLKCGHCFGRGYKKLPNLIGKKEINEIARKVDEFQEDNFKIEIAKFCGTTGEPLVNDVIVEGIDLFKNLGKKIIVYTNGLDLDKKVESGYYYEHMLEVNKLNLSLDAGSEEVFMALKGKEGFYRIINSLENILEKRNKLNSDLDIVVSFVIGRKNYTDVVNATKIIKNTGAENITFRVDFTDIEFVRSLSSVIIDNLNEAKGYSSDCFDVVSAYSEENISEDDSAFHSYGRKCFNCYFWACIGPDVELYACGHRCHGGVKSYGSLLNNNFKDLWASLTRKESIKNLPDERCWICSPSSTRRNDFMTFLSNISLEKMDELKERYI